MAKKPSSKPAGRSKPPKKTARPTGKTARKTARTVGGTAPRKAVPARPVVAAAATSAPGTGISRGGGPSAISPTTRGASPRVVVVVETSNNGPLDIRAITLNQRMIVTNVSTSNPRSEFDITDRFQAPASIGWEIFAGIQFPRAGVFLERAGLPTLPLGQQAPLKQGVAWLDEKDVES